MPKDIGQPKTLERPGKRVLIVENGAFGIRLVLHYTRNQSPVLTNHSFDLNVKTAWVTQFGCNSDSNSLNKDKSHFSSMVLCFWLHLIIFFTELMGWLKQHHGGKTTNNTIQRIDETLNCLLSPFARLSSKHGLHILLYCARYMVVLGPTWKLLLQI